MSFRSQGDSDLLEDFPSRCDEEDDDDSSCDNDNNTDYNSKQSQPQLNDFSKEGAVTSQSLEAPTESQVGTHKNSPPASSGFSIFSALSSSNHSRSSRIFGSKFGILRLANSEEDDISTLKECKSFQTLTHFTEEHDTNVHKSENACVIVDDRNLAFKNNTGVNLAAANDSQNYLFVAKSYFVTPIQSNDDSPRGTDVQNDLSMQKNYDSRYEASDEDENCLVLDCSIRRKRRYDPSVGDDFYSYLDRTTQIQNLNTLNDNVDADNITKKSSCEESDTHSDLANKQFGLPDLIKAKNVESGRNKLFSISPNPMIPVSFPLSSEKLAKTELLIRPTGEPHSTANPSGQQALAVFEEDKNNNLVEGSIKDSARTIQKPPDLITLKVEMEKDSTAPTEDEDGIKNEVGTVIPEADKPPLLDTVTDENLEEKPSHSVEIKSEEPATPIEPQADVKDETNSEEPVTPIEPQADVENEPADILDEVEAILQEDDIIDSLRKPEAVKEIIETPEVSAPPTDISASEPSTESDVINIEKIRDITEEYEEKKDVSNDYVDNNDDEKDADGSISSSSDSALPPVRDIVVTKSSTDSSNSTRSSNKTPTRRKRNKGPTKASFTADSPYYSAYVDKEVQSLSMLSATLEDIVAKAHIFGKCGAAMAEATRNLSISCKLEQPSPHFTGGRTGDPELDETEMRRESQFQRDRRESVGKEMATSLKLLGDVSILNFCFTLCLRSLIVFPSLSSYLKFMFTGLG